jgi:hypothetical protein
MTRPNQKVAERNALELLLSAIGVEPDERPIAGEGPDFVISVLGRSIGVEITTFQSGARITKRITRRAAEAAWDELDYEARAFRAERPGLINVNIGLMFKSHSPSPKECRPFLFEIAEFVANNKKYFSEKRMQFFSRNFITPLMNQYLQSIDVRLTDFAEWYSINNRAGWVSRAGVPLSKILRCKSAKTYRATEELWLAIQCSYRISETLLGTHDGDDLAAEPDLAAALQASPFTSTAAQRI